MTVHHSRYAGKTLSRSESFFRIEPDVLCLSTIKKAEKGDAVIVRFYNPSDHVVDARLWCRQEMKKAELLKLCEEPLKDLSVDAKHTVRLEVPSKKIITLGIHFCR